MFGQFFLLMRSFDYVLSDSHNKWYQSRRFAPTW